MGLDQLKPGDKAIAANWRKHRLVVVVDKITATQFVCRWFSGGTARGIVRFRRSDGRKMGCERVDDMYHLRSATPDDLAAVEVRDLARRLAETPAADWERLGLGPLQVIAQTLANAQPWRPE